MIRTEGQIHYYYLSYIFLVLIGIRCKSVDSIPTASLDLTVIDINASPVENVEITVYGSREDWVAEENSILSKKVTNSLGKLAIFDLKDEKYYVDARKDSLNNWENNVEISLTRARFGFSNTAYIILAFSISGIIASPPPSGKLWRVENIETLHALPEEVSALNLEKKIFTFYKGGTYTQRDNQSNRFTLSERETWTLDSRKTTLILSREKQFIYWEIIEIEKNLLKVRQTINDKIFVITYKSMDK